MPRPPGGEMLDASEIPLNNSVNKSSRGTEVKAGTSEEEHFLDVLQETNPAKASTSIITSATKILKEGEHQWLNCEVKNEFLN